MATAESHHWYDKDGRPVYEVMGAGGKLVTPDVRHARKFGLVPGVTSIINCAAKPGLERWKAQQLAMAMATLPRLEGESEDDFIERAVRDSGEQARAARDEGTAIHASIEMALAGDDYDPAHARYVERTLETLNDMFGGGFECERTFATADYGGKIDLFKSRGEKVWVLDLKTKDFDDNLVAKGKTKLAWDEHAMQLAAYASAFTTLDKVCCANIFLNRAVPGNIYVHRWDETELARALKMFNGLLAYWKAKNKIEARQPDV